MTQDLMRQLASNAHISMGDQKRRARTRRAVRVAEGYITAMIRRRQIESARRC
ncbi:MULTISPECIES: hypothetical protein [Dethiosulfovibrio]|uniref:Uncharacterized protein n=2 Tax=Dethiosulfovibrio TaxID=47054 RepID=A0ABS9EQY0_9BACT|nr:MULTISPECIES: hypothetical protein [Dethiosulfovibrio]MCF4115116.1 hypothetical protein [Dethiosulfovibrio russensis]MCF4143605.1 hypothetical protein [Dethiosulfovibrio marinus]MCF4146076.1 hypothetical protein [Dethiosulfovibrio acidaminovorans]